MAASICREPSAHDAPASAPGSKLQHSRHGVKTTAQHGRAAVSFPKQLKASSGPLAASHCGGHRESPPWLMQLQNRAQGLTAKAQAQDSAQGVPRTMSEVTGSRLGSRRIILTTETRLQALGQGQLEPSPGKFSGTLRERKTHLGPPSLCCPTQCSLSLSTGQCKSHIFLKIRNLSCLELKFPNFTISRHSHPPLILSITSLYYWDYYNF